MFLKEERQRIIAFVSSEKTRVLPTIRALASERLAAAALCDLAEKVFEVLETTLEARLRAIEERDGALPDIASERFQGLLSGIQTTIGLIASAADNQQSIPREIYSLTSWFFTKTAAEHPLTFVLTLSYNELATTDFRQFLTSMFAAGVSGRSRYPELVKAFADRKFVFIHVPSPMAQLARAADWPLLFHECAHALEQCSPVVGPLFPGLTRDWTTLISMAKVGIPEATEALRTEEFVCDFIATHVAGPAFVWAFLRCYSALSGVFHPPVTHPRLDVRVNRLADLLRKRGFESQADEATAALRTLVEDADVPDGTTVDKADAAQKYYEDKITGVNMMQFEATLAAKSATGAKELIQDLKTLRPVLLPPESLYTLVAFQPDCEDARIGPLLADMIRLHEVEARFRALGLPG